MPKSTLLAICDSPTVNTGFGVVSQNVLNVLSEDFDVHVLGINYLGDPHALQSRYKIYAPLTGGDVYGFNRLQEMLNRVNPDVIWILNDPWLVAEYVLRIRKMGYQKSIVVYTPIDSPGIKREYIEPLNQATHVVSYTQWGLDEMKKRGLTVASSVIPHGVNINLFQPLEKQIARKEIFKGIQGFNYQDAFIVLYIARSQPRKRVDLYPYIIAQWMQRFPHDNVFFYYHGAAKGDLGNDIEYVSFDEGVGQRLILTSKDMTPQTMIPVERLKYIYSAADVYLQICAVEGLTTRPF